jgi:hypothetical protein
LVFLLSAIYPLLTYIGLREGRRAWVMWGVVAAILAILAHPAAGLLVGGLGLWMLVTFSQRSGELRRLSARSPARWALVGMAALVGVIATRLVPMLAGWIATPHVRRLRGPALILSHVDGLTAPLVLVGIAGILWLWRQDRSLALLLAGLAVVPAVFLTVLSYWTAVSTVYLFTTAPVVFIGAGVFLDRLADLERGQRAGSLVTLTVLAVLLATCVPGLWSEYRDGGRPDFRAAAGYLRRWVRPGDQVISDEPRTLAHYLPGSTVARLERRPKQLPAALSALQARGPERKLWVVVRASARAGFKNHKLGLGSIGEWVYGTCQLRASIGVPRLDWRSNELQIFQCPVGAEVRRLPAGPGPRPAATLGPGPDSGRVLSR